MSSEIERLKQAAGRDPAALIRLADTLVAAGRADEAVQYCRRGIAQRPDDVPLRLALGRALSAAGHLEEAQAALLDAVSRQALKAPEDRSPSTSSPTPLPPPAVPEPEPATREWSPYGASPEPYRAPADSEPIETYQEPVRRARAESPRPPARPIKRPSGQRPMIPPPQTHSPREENGYREEGGYREESAYREDSAYREEDAYREESAYEEPRGPIDLETIADRLRAGAGVSGEGGGWESEEAPSPPLSDEERRWREKRSRAFIWLWASLVLVTAGVVAGTIYRAKQRAKMLAITVEKADARMLEASYEGDLVARDAYASAVRVEPHERKYFAMVALADARLSTDDGDDTDAAAWAMLRRAEREEKRHPDPDPRADREQRQARALLALGRAEACTPVVDAEDGDIAARCAAQKGDVAGARRILQSTIQGAGGPKAHLRALFALGSLELGAGDLDAAEHAYDQVLQILPEHPRAVVGRALVGLERGETPEIVQPPGRLGPTTSAWFHLARGLVLLKTAKTAADDALASRELDAAQQGIVHDGRLALLYGRARLMQGHVSDAEQAMRIAERLDPNDGDVAVLDAEVALAKGFEDKVATALAQGPPTPRRLAVLGRALCLTGRYREAVAALDAALARRPGDATAITYRAIAHAHLGDMSGALRELERAAAQIGPGVDSAPHYGLGLLAYERHDLLRAKSELSRALAHNSESFRARALLGRVLRDLGKPKEALAELEKVEVDAPALTSVHSTLGRIYLDLGRYREARAELRKVLDDGKATSDDKLGYAEATIQLGMVQEGESALSDAVDAGALASKVGRLKLLLQSWKGPKEALAAAKVLEKQRKGAAAHDAQLALAAADAWRRAGDLKRASDDLRAALFGDALHANLGLGRVQLLQNDPVSAEASFRAALDAWQRGPYGVDDQTQARIGLARALLLRKSAGDALAALTPCVTDDPAAPEPHLWMARAWLEQGKRAQALAQAVRATELDDQYAEAFLLVGELSQKGHRDQAKKAYRRYLELQPSGSEARSVKRILASLR